jgi:hypothetical protein
MQKAVGIIWFVIVFFLGWMFVGSIAFFGSGTYTGHTGYCQSDALPFYNAARVLPFIIAVLLVLYWIIVEAFLGYERQTGIVRVLLPLCLTLLAYVLYNICRYPFVNRRYGFLAQSAYAEGMHNLLVFSGSVLSVFLLLFTLRFHYKLPALKKLSLLTYAGVAVFFIVVTLVYRFATHVFCEG